MPRLFIQYATGCTREPLGLPQHLLTVSFFTGNN